MEEFRTLLADLQKIDIPDRLYYRITGSFGSLKNINLSILEGVLKNQDLFDVFAIFCNHVTNDFDKIVHLKEQNIMIYVQQLNLYGIVSLESYEDFCKALVSRKILPSIYQLVMMGDRQKIVLLCENSVRKLVESKFGGTLGIYPHVVMGENKCEITLQDKFVDNYEEIRDIYLDVISKISPSVQNIGEYLTMMNPVMGPNPYMKYNISDSVRRDITREILVGILKTPITGDVTVQVIENNYGNVGNITNIERVPHQLTKDWIAANPPDNTIKSEYYDLYRNSDNYEGITAYVFGRIMVQLGHKEGYIGKQRTWKKP